MAWHGRGMVKHGILLHGKSMVLQDRGIVWHGRGMVWHGICV